MPSETITISNRDLRLALSALETIVKDRGVPDHKTAMHLGKTMRRLRDARDLSGESYDILLMSHAMKDETGKPIVGTKPGSFQVEDQATFFAESRKLDAETMEVEVWPIVCTALQTKKDRETCSKCKQIIGMPDPEAFATLIDVGILLDEDGENA
jgi:hypothetical protein